MALLVLKFEVSMSLRFGLHAFGLMAALLSTALARLVIVNISFIF